MSAVFGQSIPSFSSLGCLRALRPLTARTLRAHRIEEGDDRDASIEAGQGSGSRGGDENADQSDLAFIMPDGAGSEAEFWDNGPATTYVAQTTDAGEEEKINEQTGLVGEVSSVVTKNA